MVLVSRHHPDGERHTLAAYTGLIRREPVAATVLGFALACLAGLPPGVMGLVAKVVAVRPLVDSGAWAVAVIASLNVILGLVYYLLVQRGREDRVEADLATGEAMIA